MEHPASKAETIIFNGIPFRRYPNSRHSNHRKYYSPSGKYIKQGIKNLHVEIWKAHHGPVPDGHQIHHRDRNPLNNEIDNLESLSANDHSDLHREEGRVRAAISFQKSGREKAFRAGAANWHGSEEGRKWHQEHSKSIWADRVPVQYICEQCSKPFESRKIGGVRFCSNPCKSKWRRAAGLDNVTRVCARTDCGILFTSNRYDEVQYCSRSCAHSRPHKKAA